MKFVSYPRRIRVGLDAMLADYDKGEYPFSPDILDGPQLNKNLPAGLTLGGIEEVNYYIGLCNYMLAAQDSMAASRAFAVLYSRDGDRLFDWEQVTKLSITDIKQALLGVGLTTRANEVAQAWATNAPRILERYDGDIRKLYERAGGDWRVVYAELINTKRGDGLRGYQEKMASMLSFFLMKKGLVPYFPMPPQVDFHVMRVFWQCNLVLPTRDGEPVFKMQSGPDVRRFCDAIRLALLDYERDGGRCWLDTSEALWVQSRSLCSATPSNSTTKRAANRRGLDGELAETEEADSELEPPAVPPNHVEKAQIALLDEVPTQAKKASRGMPERPPIEWSQEKRLAYRASCGRCSLELHCTGSIPAGFYYNNEQNFLRWFPRELPPDDRERQLFDPD